jgi:GTP-binding protein
VRSLVDNIFEEELVAFSKEHSALIESAEDFNDQAPEQGSPVSVQAKVQAMRVAIVGRPNAGKSTLINTLLGEERVIAYDQPGTTRDALSIDFKHQGRDYTLVDTAGLRKRGKVHEVIEKFSVVKTLQAIEQSHVCVLMLDAGEGVGHLDAGIANYILDAGRAVVVAVNKWDSLDVGAKQNFKRTLLQSLQFLQFAELCFISAKHGRGLASLMRAVDQAFAAAMAKLPTPKLTRALREAVERQQPPRKGPFRPKLRYAHQGGQNPPVVIIHGNSLDRIPDTYQRYLESWFREVFKLQGTPLRIEWRSSTNPYAKED